MLPTLKRGLPALAACLPLAFSAGTSADSLTLGDKFPEGSFVDQFDATHSLRDCPRLLFAPDRPSSEIANRLLADDGLAARSRDGLCYVANISGMPAIITRLFALPAMREYPYPVLLERDGSQTADWPQQAEHLTVIDVVDGRIAQLGFAANEDEAAGLLATGAR